MLFGAICFGDMLRRSLRWQRKTQVWVGFTLFSSLQTLLWYDSLSVARKDILGTSEYFVQEQRGLGFSLQHESFLPHKFSSFVLAKGDTLSPSGLEDLQTDNSVQTTLKNITLLEQPQGWDQGFEKGPFRFPSALHPEQSLPDNTEISFFLWIKPPLQEKYANAIRGSLVWGYSPPAIFALFGFPGRPSSAWCRPAFQFTSFTALTVGSLGLPLPLKGAHLVVINYSLHIS